MQQVCIYTCIQLNLNRRRPYKCGKHVCKDLCHPCNAPSTLCPFDPSVVKTCPCGSLSIPDLLSGSDRKSCSDPVPTCSSVCNKLLACGHRCKKKCHTGECSRCDETVQVTCRCLSTNFERVCADVCEALGGETPLCNKTCKVKRNCGRHSCGIMCCPAEKRSNNHVRNEMFAEKSDHECNLDCDRMLSCGVHKCDRKCHKGKCQPCMGK